METNLLNGPLLCFGLGKPKGALEAIRLCLECTSREALNLQLPTNRRELRPAADAALINAKRRCDCGLCPVMGDHFGGLHDL